MHLPFSWLKEWIDLSESAEEIAEHLTKLGLEVEGIERTPLLFKGVVVAQVTETVPHPNAEKLQIATVFDGTASHSVVCGAPNCRPGLTTAMAPVGSTLGGSNTQTKPFKIKKTKLRGVESNGMLCSATELALGEDNLEELGIMELPESYQVGSLLESYYDDPILIISLTPNLAHGASVQGIAGELAALLKRELLSPFAPPTNAEKKQVAHKERSRWGITVEATHACPRYCARKMKVAVGPSPKWMQQRLIASGMRPINNVVDATNYVQLELGQPLHAFDGQKILGSAVSIRYARPGEALTTLDNTFLALTKEMVCIADAKRPIALAGVMGGLETEVSDQTTEIFLEGAYFTTQAVRLNSKHSGLKTESSKRFERGCDPNGIKQALDRATELMIHWADGKEVEDVADTAPTPFPKQKIKLRIDRLNALLGTQLAMGEVESLLKRLYFSSARNTSVTTLTILVPTNRPDVQSEVDLIEEVGRLYGYHHIPKQAPTLRVTSIPHSPLFIGERQVRHRLLLQGLTECITHHLISPRQAEMVTPSTGACVEVINPSSAEHSVLRPSLLPGLLQTVRFNQHYQRFNMRLFEIGSIHSRQGRSTEKSLVEETVAAIVLSGCHHLPHWQDKQGSYSFYTLKGIVEALLLSLGKRPIFELAHAPFFHPGQQAVVKISSQKRDTQEIGTQGIGTQEIGTLGQLHPKTLRQADIQGPVFAAEMNLKALIPSRSHHQATSLPQFPASERDWTIPLPTTLSAQAFLDTIQSVPSSLLKKVAIIDMYTGSPVPENKKNLTVRLTYRSDRTTLSLEKIEKEHARVTSSTLAQLGISS